MKTRCTLKSTTESEAIKAIFKVGCGGWLTYTCALCGKNHIISENTKIV